MRHALTVPVRVGGVDTRFILDTGAGLNAISGALAERVGCRLNGSTYTGKRMSGQAMTIPLGTVSSLDLGDHASTDVQAGILDVHALAGIEGVEGILSLTYFRAVRLDYDSCSTDLFLGVDLPSGRRIMAEVDTGSDIIVLDPFLRNFTTTYDLPNQRMIFGPTG